MKILLLSILILSALTNLCSGGRSPGFVWSRYCISHSRNLGGARPIIELCFKFRGEGNAPPRPISSGPHVLFIPPLPVPFLSSSIVL